jgi:YesN/AraC family two-component response regulator
MAVNGAEGIEKAREIVPDLIISDVMMPIKDGFELCKVLKADELTSHVPIILLTARADAASRIAGLKRGADAYLAKPFEPAELLVHVENLIRLRRQLQKRYTSAEQLPRIPSTDPDLELEDAFILKIREVIKQDLRNGSIEIPELGKAMGMSRSQLFRKIKALTGTSPSLLVRSIRLQEAQIILRETDLNIAEVAYEVGFSTPAYFSTAFLEEFGSSPSEWRLQVKNAS